MSMSSPKPDIVFSQQPSEVELSSLVLAYFQGPEEESTRRTNALVSEAVLVEVALCFNLYCLRNRDEISAL